MNPRPTALLSTALIALLAGCASSPTTSSSTSDNSGASPTMTATTDSPETTLQKGMTADAVKAIMGDPVEIRPMKSPAGNAEIWVYRRSTRGATLQVQVGTKSTPITTTNSTGQSMVLQTIDEPILRQQTEIIDETIYLLIFNGNFQQLNRSVQKHLQYE
jgi:outer membrane protein assembly factor BamE (lipoprotein component of BamABCDE complex)